jgi:hypothetical protein
MLGELAVNRGQRSFRFSGFAIDCSIPEDFHFSIFAFGQFKLDLAAHFDFGLPGFCQWNAEPILFCSEKKPRGFGKGNTASRRLRRDGASSGSFVITAENTFHCRAPLHSLARPRQRATAPFIKLQNSGERTCQS